MAERKKTHKTHTGQHLSIKRNAFITVLVLVIVLPLAIFVLTYWVNKTAARRSINLRIERSVENAYRLRREVERALRLAQDLGYVNVQPVYRPLPDGTRAMIYDAYVTPAFKDTLHEIEPGDEMLDFAQLLDARGQVITWFGERGKDSKTGDVQVTPDETPKSLAIQVHRIAEISRWPVITLAFPTKVGHHIAGTLVVGLSFNEITREVRQEMHENNRRALIISLAGSILLAVLGVYMLVLNERTRKLQVALEKEQHLAHVGTLSAGLAHEIRNPLSSVKMNVQMIRNRLSKLDVEEREKLQRKIERVAGETDRLEQSLNDFLVYAAPRPVHKELTDVNALVRDTVEMTGNTDGEISTKLSPDLPKVGLDQALFVQLLRNLLINAQQATGPDGHIEVITAADRRQVTIDVCDDGPGVPEQEREKIFEIFYTSRKAGTGLGLNIARRIAEDHGGTITVDESHLGGARFRIILPIKS